MKNVTFHLMSQLVEYTRMYKHSIMDKTRTWLHLDVGPWSSVARRWPRSSGWGAWFPAKTWHLAAWLMQESWRVIWQSLSLCLFFRQSGKRRLRALGAKWVQYSHDCFISSLYVLRICYLYNVRFLQLFNLFQAH